MQENKQKQSSSGKSKRNKLKTPNSNNEASINQTERSAKLTTQSKAGRLPTPQATATIKNNQKRPTGLQVHFGNGWKCNLNQSKAGQPGFKCINQLFRIQFELEMLVSVIHSMIWKLWCGSGLTINTQLWSVQQQQWQSTWNILWSVQQQPWQSTWNGNNFKRKND